ncbi:MAG TPA: UDP-N-acetylglucosamine 2-epimerase [Candidatus Binatia bacterium]|nr:UDP-N-acetylglucosamine 2-epimerase [Candidatus Binatia bacterium]
MKKRKICVVVTARPSYSRIKTVLRGINNHPDLELQLVVAASALLDRYGNAVKFIEADGFEIAARVYMVLEGENPIAMAKTAGIGLIELATTFDHLAPDIVVTVADRYETLATAVAGSYLNLPVGHVQGGEITGSIDEKVRHAVTKLSNVHFVATQKAAERVTRMGEDPAAVFVTGCPSIDLVADILKSPGLNFDPIGKYGGVGCELNWHNDYIVVLQHPVTTEYELAKSQVLETLFAIRDLGVPTFWFWPNVDAGSDGVSNAIRAFRENENPTNIHFFKNMAPEDFLRLLYNSRCIVGNSSVGIRECSYMGVPVVNIGNRQEGRERGNNVIDVAHNRCEVFRALKHHLRNGRYCQDRLYGDGKAGELIAQKLAEIPLQIEKRLTY